MSANQSAFPITVKCGNVKVKIYRINSQAGYTYYQVADHSQGKRQLRTYSDLKEAKVNAQDIARKLANHDAEVLGMTKADRAKTSVPTMGGKYFVCGSQSPWFTILIQLLDYNPVYQRLMLLYQIPQPTAVPQYLALINPAPVITQQK